MYFYEFSAELYFYCIFSVGRGISAQDKLMKHLRNPRDAIVSRGFFIHSLIH